MLVQIECGNEQCPGRKFDEDEGRETGHIYLATEIPATRYDPSCIEGECDLCGEETTEFEVERLTAEDIDEMRNEAYI